MSTLKKALQELRNLQGTIGRMEVSFIDENIFRKNFNMILNPPHHEDRWFSTIAKRNNIDITGYFSEAAVKPLCRLKKSVPNIRLISPELNLSRNQDQRNLRALRKMQDEDIKIKIHKRIHSRLLLSYTIADSNIYGMLLLGSFDLNKEGTNAERRDAGIVTEHPDLVKSDIDYFNNVWEEEYEIKWLDEEYPPKKN